MGICSICAKMSRCVSGAEPVAYLYPVVEPKDQEELDPPHPPPLPPYPPPTVAHCIVT